MKRLLIILGAALLLTACGNDSVHKNINESLAEDSKAILEIATSAVEEGRSLTEKEERAIEGYEKKYSASSEAKSIDLTIEDIALFVATEGLISSAEAAENQYGLPSDQELFELRVERFESAIKTGEIISEKELKELTK